MLALYETQMKAYLLPYLLMIIAAVAGCENFAEKKPVSNDHKKVVVQVGVVGPMGGPEKGWGESGLSGVQAAVELHNRSASNFTVELLVEDETTVLENLKKGVSTFVEPKPVSGLLLLSQSDTTLALKKYIEKLTIPTLALMSTHPDITKESDWINQLLFDDNMQATAAALYVRDELLLDQVGVVIDKTNPHSLYLAEQFINTFDSSGGASVEIPFFKNKKLYQSRMRGAQENGIDFVYLPLDGEGVVYTVRALKEIGYDPTLMSGDSLQADLLLHHPEVLQEVDGMLATDPFATDGRRTEYGKRIQKLYDQEFDIQGTVLAAQGAEGASILFEAIEGCHENVEPGCINRALRETRDFEGILDKISIKADGKAERPIYINEIDGVRLRRVVKVY